MDDHVCEWLNSLQKRCDEWEKDVESTLSSNDRPLNSISRIIYIFQLVLFCVGLVVGFYYGFLYAGIGGAIVGLCIGMIASCIATLIFNFASMIFISLIPDLIEICLLVLFLIFVVYIISMLWGVGRP